MAGALAVFGGLGQGVPCSGRNWRFDPFPLGAFDIFFPCHRAGARDLSDGFPYVVEVKHDGPALQHANNRGRRQRIHYGISEIEASTLRLVH